MYEAFAYDFGPLHLGHVVKYFLGLKKKMEDPQLAHQKYILIFRPTKIKCAKDKFVLIIFSILLIFFCFRIVHFCGVEPTQFRPNPKPKGCEWCDPMYNPPRVNGYFFMVQNLNFKFMKSLKRFHEIYFCN